MIISHSHKFIFIKTRKTAGSSIESYLVNNYLGPNDVCTGSPIDGTRRLNTFHKNGHMDCITVMNLYPQEWASDKKNYYKFAVERNPWDKLVSLYFFYKKWKPKKVKFGFETFIKEQAEQYNDWYMYTCNDKILVDDLLNYDNLHKHLKNIPIPYNNELLTVRLKSNTRQNKNYREMYNEDTKRSVEQVFEKPIQHFGYTF